MYVSDTTPTYGLGNKGEREATGIPAYLCGMTCTVLVFSSKPHVNNPTRDSLDPAIPSQGEQKHKDV